MHKKKLFSLNSSFSFEQKNTRSFSHSCFSWARSLVWALNLKNVLFMSCKSCWRWLSSSQRMLVSVAAETKPIWKEREGEINNNNKIPFWHAFALNGRVLHFRGLKSAKFPLNKVNYKSTNVIFEQICVMMPILQYQNVVH